MNRKPTPVSHKLFITITLLVTSLGILAAGWYCIRFQSGAKVPNVLTLGMPNHPYSILVMGTDVPYARVAPRKQQGDRTAFTGRSDTMMLVIVDPQRRTVRGVNIPRDTVADIPGYGVQKVNAANAIGGPRLAACTVAQMLNVTVDHYVVLNVYGLVDAVNELGGVTVAVPKKMSYMDWTAKLKIDLEEGTHTLTGNQAMGFVRFRHDELGDIGRIQRQQIFMHAVISKLLNPITWVHVPKLVEITERNMLTDMTELQLLQAFNLARSVPREQIQFAMLPGHFGGNGSWVPDEIETSRLVARMYGLASGAEDRHNLTICLRDASTVPGLADHLATMLRKIGYSVVVTRTSPLGQAAAMRHTRIIAQRGNYEDAQMVLSDLGHHGEIVNASVGDIYSSITVLVADDLQSVLTQDIAADSSRLYH